MASRRDWRSVEVEATVAAYLEMLSLELQGLRYNKAERRRSLQALLVGRTEGAIERKHQNISAILIELGLPYVDGYKPLGNYQDLLRDVVEQRLGEEPRLLALVAAEVERPAEEPTIDDILRALVDRPEPRRRDARYSRERRVARPSRRPNYLLREIRNASLGLAGERFVLDYERARLVAARQDRLAASVEHVAATRGDGEGFDILSFEQDGAERLIEVKTTGFGRYTPFFVSPNEVDVSRREHERYHLYRVFTFRQDPRLFTVTGALDRSFDLEASEFVARV